MASEKAVINKAKKAPTKIIEGDVGKANKIISDKENEKVKEIKEEKIELTREQQIDQALAIGISKKKMGLCKNNKCYNASRVGSSYCQECSDKHKNSIVE